MRALPLLSFMGGLILVWPLSAQEEEPSGFTFRLSVDFIEVTAIVTDPAGKVVPDLTRDDFQILEDGRPQTIEAFAFVDLPRRPRRRAPDGSLPESDVRANLDASGRLFAFLIDDLRTPPADRTLLRARARELVEKTEEGDLAAVLYTSGRQRSVSFTTSRAMLVEALKATAGRGPADSNRDLRVSDIKDSLSMVEGVAGLLETITGRRKSIVYFGPGSNYDLTQTFGRFGPEDRSYEIMLALEATVGAANRRGVSIYAVDPQGLRAPSEGDGRASLRSAYAQRESLHFLADGTGGFAIYNTNGFSEAFDRILNDNSQYYLLAYRPTNEERDGKDRTIDVRLRDPSLQVRARKGYRAPSGAPTTPLPFDGPRGVPSEVVELLRSPVPLADLSLRAVATPTSEAESRLAIMVELDVSTLSFEEKGGRYRSEVTLGVFLFGEGGDIEDGSARSVRLDLDRDELARLRRDGLRALATLPAKPGRRQVAVAARERNGEKAKAGLLYWYLDVPEVGAPSASSIILSSARDSSAAVLSSRGDRERLPLMPTVRRDFDPKDELWLHVPSALESVGARVLREDGSVVSEASVVRDENPWRIPLANLKPGGYFLELGPELSDRATRTIFFSVRRSD
ncbi:MAG TPA: VWA domain-containing protein [Vicinamibacteria bacterium]|nr:VWA domain-containing protein [Vicinamibacteria bacterium]